MRAESLTATTKNMEELTSRLNRGEGTAGKLPTDDTLYKRLNAGQLDLVFVKWVAGAKDGTVVQQDSFAWVGLEQTSLDPAEPVPLIAYPSPSLSRKLAIDALESAGRTWRMLDKRQMRASTPMSPVFDCTTPEGRRDGIAKATAKASKSLPTHS